MAFYSIYNRENAGANLLRHAETQKGLPYIWSGETPGVGFDCSGLTQWSAATVGVRLDRVTYEQCKQFVLPKDAKLVPGDLLFSEGSDGTATSPGHVVIYVAPGQIFQAPFTGEDVGLYPGDTTNFIVATRPADSYPVVAVKAPAPTDIYGAQVVEVRGPEATLALKNGWAVQGWTGEGFFNLPSNGVPAGVVKYANINYRTKRK